MRYSIYCSFLFFFFFAFCYSYDTIIIDQTPQSVFDYSGLTFRDISPLEAKEQGYSFSYRRSGLFANRPFRAGDTVMTIPISSGIGLQTVLSDLLNMNGATFSFEEEPFVVWLMVQRSLGSSSSYYEFIKTLPEKINTPLTFKDDEWSAFDDASTAMLKVRIDQDLTLLKSFYQKTNERFQSDTIAFPPDKFTFEHYIHAYTVIVDYIRSVNGNVFLFPTLRFNHSPSAKPFIVDGENIVVVASSDLEIGDQVYISFGNYSNEDLGYQHGLIIEQNPFDCVTFSISATSPYWRLVAAHYLNNTLGAYSACIPVDVEMGNPIVRNFRIIAATAEEIDRVDDILSGHFVSIRNELQTLRSLYFTLESQRVRFLTDPKDLDVPLNVKFWLNLLQYRTKTVTKILQRIVEHWHSFLSATQ